MMRTKKAFTLAEVLITLGIIGVVAAMTIPTLISNTQGAQFKTAYKKALSTMNQAVLMNLALDDSDFSSLTTDGKTGEDIDGSTNNSMAYILKNRMQSATNTTGSYTMPESITYYLHDYVCTTSDTKDSNGVCSESEAGQTVDNSSQVNDFSDWAIFSFADGISFAYNPAAANCSSVNFDCVGFIDVNGATNPNSVIACDDEDDEGTGNCTVSASNITDIYPVFFHGQTVEPASDAARAVLFGK